VTLATFFENFDQFAEVPDAVAKVRGLVLNLAVTGRLSEQRASDAPVSELAGAPSAAKAQQGKDGRRSAAAAVPPQSVIDRPIDAPPHWAWLPLNEM
jgi:type I restriction enzyme S subunit